MSRGAFVYFEINKYIELHRLLITTPFLKFLSISQGMIFIQFFEFLFFTSDNTLITILTQKFIKITATFAYQYSFNHITHHNLLVFYSYTNIYLFKIDC